MGSTFAPGRVRLLGDHLEPLGLPLIAASVDRRTYVEGVPNAQTQAFHFTLQDFADEDSFVPGATLPARHPHDWLRAAVRLVCEGRWTPDSGWEGKVQGNLPPHVGLGSQAAACIAWVRFLLETANDARASDATAVAGLAWQAAGAEAHRRADFYCCALGGVMAFECGSELAWQRLPMCSDAFVLGVALAEPTAGTTKGFPVWPLDAEARHKVASFAATATLKEARTAGEHMEAASARALLGTVMSRDLVAQGHTVFAQRNWPELGPLLTLQHAVLRDRLGLSTPKLEAMLEGAIRAGGRGGKMLAANSVIVHAPKHTQKVLKAIEMVGGEASVVHLAEEPAAVS